MHLCKAILLQMTFLLGTDKLLHLDAHAGKKQKIQPKKKCLAAKRLCLLNCDMIVGFFFVTSNKNVSNENTSEFAKKAWDNKRNKLALSHCLKVWMLKLHQFQLFFSKNMSSKNSPSRNHSFAQNDSGLIWGTLSQSTWPVTMQITFLVPRVETKRFLSMERKCCMHACYLARVASCAGQRHTKHQIY